LRPKICNKRHAEGHCGKMGSPFFSNVFSA